MAVLGSFTVSVRNSVAPLIAGATPTVGRGKVE